MFTQGEIVRVGVGNAQNATGPYEHAYASIDDASTALLDAGILSQEQGPDPLQPLERASWLHEITAEQLEKAGLNDTWAPQPEPGCRSL